MPPVEVRPEINQRNVRCPFCGRRFFYACKSKAIREYNENQVIIYMAYRCRHCGDEFTDKDILEKSKQGEEIRNAKTPEDRLEAIDRLLRKKGLIK